MSIHIEVPFPPTELRPVRKVLRPWSTAEVDVLQHHYLTHTRPQIAAMLGRTEASVRRKYEQLGFNTKKPPVWSEAEIEQMRGWYREHHDAPLETAVLGGRIGRSATAVQLKAQRIGLGDKHRITVPRIDGRYPSEMPKFSSDAARRKAVGIRIKAYIAENGHPRGALGLRHTEATKYRLAQASRQMNASRSPADLERQRLKRRDTNMKRYGTYNPAMLKVTSPYSRARRGRRDDLDNRFFRSAWEANYARYLRFLVAQQQIAAWEYEPEVFYFPGVKRAPLSYLPDFKVTENDGSVVYHEVKGWMDAKSRNKLKRMAKFYPAVRIIVIGQPEYAAIAQWAGLIEGWER